MKIVAITALFILLIPSSFFAQTKNREFEFSYCKVFGDTIAFSDLQKGAALSLADKNIRIKSFTLSFMTKNSEGKKTLVEIPVTGNVLNCDALDALKRSDKDFQRVAVERLVVSEGEKESKHPGFEFFVTIKE